MVYKATELSMIQDKSDDFKETWEFLDRRIEGVILQLNHRDN